ncbi:hypothetical protein CAEBREN_06597 [Caenorhabditis brenneri]|uniref:BTB domain-containing protein n=1 Tax=Caenorhabditis brenneri TaxID=135651 RepID=G0MUZ1_CAEBE|nr:hypothetical protein CAEBREN_06597 [Caenorhabditis brenneri]
MSLLAEFSKNPSSPKITEEIVKLNIGGTHFFTTKSTLTKFDGFFKVMVETDIPVIKDNTGAIFIDRSAKHFELILNFMRDGDVALPERKKDIQEIQKEAQFYLLDGLMTKLRFIESEDEFLQLVTEPVKPVLVFHYSVIAFGRLRYPFCVNMESFLEKYKDTFDIYFKPQKVGHNGEIDYWQWTIHYYNKYVEGKDPLNWNCKQGIEDDIEKFLKQESFRF